MNIKLLIGIFYIFTNVFVVNSQNFNTNGFTDIYMGNYGYWDYQSTGSMQSLEQDSVNKQQYNAVYLTADSSSNTPNKRVLYFYSSNGGASWGSGVVTNIESSYPSLTLQSDGKAIVCFYDSLNSRIRLYRNQSAGSMIFDSLPSPPSNGSSNPKILFYKNYIILFSVIPGGGIQRIRYKYSTNSWDTWQSIASGINNASYQCAKGYDGKICISWIGDAPINNVKFSESVDSGNTFGTANTIFTSVISGNDTIRAFSHIDLVYYNNIPSITWDAIAGILPAVGQPGIRKQFINPRIYFWNQQSGLQLIADSLTGGNSIPGRNFTISMGYNYSTICAPSIGISTYLNNSYLFIGYSAAKTNVPFGNSWFDSDVYLKISTTGNSWNFIGFIGPDNVYDDRFVSMVKKNYNNFGYSFALIEQKDRFPGSFRVGDTTSITRAYPEFYLINVFTHTAGELGTEEEFDLCPAYPNPFNAQTRIEYFLKKKAGIILDVYDLLGRNVETLFNGVSNTGSSYVIFNGTNRSSGVYFVRMFVDGNLFAAEKIVLSK